MFVSYHMVSLGCHRVAMYFHAPCGTFVFYVVIVNEHI